jgi:hypothetical protein
MHVLVGILIIWAAAILYFLFNLQKFLDRRKAERKERWVQEIKEQRLRERGAARGAATS